MRSRQRVCAKPCYTNGMTTRAAPVRGAEEDREMAVPDLSEPGRSLPLRDHYDGAQRWERDAKSREHDNLDKHHGRQRPRHVALAVEEAKGLRSLGCWPHGAFGDTKPVNSLHLESVPAEGHRITDARGSAEQCEY